MANSLSEKLSKIRDSPKLQSQQQTHLVLSAVEDTLRDQRTEFTPTAYFSALLALLSQYISTKGVVNKDVATAVVYLLDLITPHTPAPLLRAKFSQILQKLAVVLTFPDADAPILRPSLGCLESLLLVQDAQAWQMSQAQISPRRAVAGLLNIAVDHRPKVRKRAQDALAKVLQSPPPSPSLDHPAADMCAEAALRTLKEGAEATRRQKKTSSNKDAQLASPNLIHTLQLIKTIANASGGWPSRKLDALCELLLEISKSSNEFLTMTSFEVYEVIFAGMADEVSSAKLPRLLEVLEGLQPSENDSQLMPPWIAVLSRGYDVAAQVLPQETFHKLPIVFARIMTFMSSMSHNVRVSAADCLISFLVNCIPFSAITNPTTDELQILQSTAKLGVELLSVKYQAAWEDAFRVLAAMFDALHWHSETLLVEAIQIVGQLRSSDAFNGKKEADAVLSKAIAVIGPAKVLEIIPLNLLNKSSEPGRVWLLPLMRDSVRNTQLSHFKQELVPLSGAMFERILAHGQAEKTVEVKIYETIVQQIWATLPGYCDLPTDLIPAFDQSFAEIVSNVLYQQVELRTDLCRALQRLVESNNERIELDETEPAVSLLRVTKADAEANIQHLQGFASNLLSILFNVYTTTLPQYRGPALQCIDSYLSITPEQEVIETFERVVKMIEEALPESNGRPKAHANGNGKDGLPPLSHTLMDLVTTIAPYLPRQSYATLFGVAASLLHKSDPNLQKKAYKIIPRLAESELGRQALQERSEELQALLLNCAEAVVPAARRDRLASIAQIINSLPSSSLHFVPTIMPEVVLATKETNEKARRVAFDLLIAMGELMQQGGTITQSKVPHMPDDAAAVPASLEEFFTMVSAGLAGSAAHTVSATITAITRILYHFRNSLAETTVAELVETMDIFLKSQNREIVRSVLGFVKVCVIILPTSLVQPRLATLIPNLLTWSHEHKAHLQAKVKHIFERMIRRFGADLIEKLTPEKDRKLVTNIRKTRERRKKKKTAGADDDEQTNGAEGVDSKPARRFESGLDEAIYGSNDESDSGSDVSDDEVLGRKRSRRGANGQTYIVEDDDEPLDLLDQRALSNISSTKPLAKSKMKQKPRAAKVNLDGKLVIGNDDASMQDADAATINTTTGTADQASVNAYVQALKGGNAARKGAKGKLKFSNKPSRERADDDDEDDGEMDVDGGELVKQLKKARGGQSGGKRAFVGSPGGARQRAGPGRGGMKAAKAQRRGLGAEKTRGGRIVKGATAKVGRH